MAVSLETLVAARRESVIISDSPPRSLEFWEAMGGFLEPDTAAIDVAGMALGAVSANTLPGFENPACTVFQQDNWTPTNTKYLAADDYTKFIQTEQAAYRDVEVDTWARDGIVFLRSTSGSAIFFYHNGETPNGTLVIGFVSGLTEGVGFYGGMPNGTYFSLYENTNLVGTVPDGQYNRTDTAGAYFTFGADGFDIYAKFNGIEIARFQNFRAAQAGKIAIQGNNGYGFRDVAVRYNLLKVLYSAPPARYFDLRDFGLIDLETTGSMAASSNILTVADTSGFAVGQRIIVEVGGETGGGARGTIGVGGAWPALSFPSFPNFDPAPADTYAWAEDTGQVYRYQSSTWTPVPSAQYYVTKAHPLALVATITEISGNDLVLDESAVVATANPKVYYDNSGVLNGVLGAVDPVLVGMTPTGLTFNVPPGKYALSELVTVDRKAAGALQGAGKTETALFSPPGTKSAMVLISYSDAFTARDFEIRGNARFEGYGLAVTQTNIPQGDAYPCGVFFSHVEGGVARDILGVDNFQSTVGAGNCQDVWAYNCDSVLTQGLQCYIQWMFNWADCVGGGIVDCTVTSPILTAGFEAFRSSGVQIIRPVSHNAVFSINSTGAWLIDAPRVTISADSYISQDQFSNQNPIIAVNSNIIPPDSTMEEGGAIHNPWIVQEGYINSNNDSLRGITVDSQCPNITISGTFPDYPGSGYIRAPDFASPSSMYGSAGIDIEGQDGIVRGIRVVGASNTYPNILNRLSSTYQEVSNCIADTICGAETNNLTNADWLSIHPGDNQPPRD